jgi:hypothetical protein
MIRTTLFAITALLGFTSFVTATPIINGVNLIGFDSSQTVDFFVRQYNQCRFRHAVPFEGRLRQRLLRARTADRTEQQRLRHHINHEREWRRRAIQLGNRAQTE